MSMHWHKTLKKRTRFVLGAQTDTTLPKKVTRSSSRLNPPPVVSEEIPETPTKQTNMDSGNISDPSRSITPTVSNTNSNLSTTFKPKDIMTFVSHLPPFDGSPRYLDRFITSVEEILMLTRSADQTPYGLLTLRAIRNKIIGRADETLELANTPLIWDEIKNNLTRMYSNKKTEACLLSELQLFADNLSLGQLFFGISKIKSQLFSSFQSNGESTAVIEAKKTLYNQVCLNTFIKGLRQPLKTLIRLKDPKTIEQAYEQCKVEQSLSYNRRSYNNAPNNPQQYQTQNANNSNHRDSRNNYNYQPYPNNNQFRNNSNNRRQNNGYNNNNSNNNSYNNRQQNPFKIENPPTHGLHNIDLDNQTTAEPNFPAPASNRPDT